MVSIYSVGFAATVLADVEPCNKAIFQGSTHLPIGVNLLSIFLLPLTYLLSEFSFVVLTPFAEVCGLSLQVPLNPLPMVSLFRRFLLCQLFRCEFHAENNRL